MPTGGSGNMTRDSEPLLPFVLLMESPSAGGGEGAEEEEACVLPMAPSIAVRFALFVVELEEEEAVFPVVDAVVVLLFAFVFVVDVVEVKDAVAEVGVEDDDWEEVDPDP